MADDNTPEGEASGNIAAGEEPIGNGGGETGDILDTTGAATPPLSDGKAHVAVGPGGQDGVPTVVPDTPRSAG